MNHIDESEAEPDVFENICKRTEDFFKLHGRRPRMLAARIGQHGYDSGFAGLANSFAKFGFDVDISPVLSNSSEAAKIAIENDVHVVEVTILSNDNLEMVLRLIQDLGNRGREDIIVAAAGVILPGDLEYLFDCGVKAVCTSGTSINYFADRVLTLVENR